MERTVTTALLLFVPSWMMLVYQLPYGALGKLLATAFLACLCALAAIAISTTLETD